MITPVELLNSELNKYIKAKRKSKEAYDAGKISLELHETHITNLEPKIKQYFEAVVILEKGLR